MTDFQPPWEQKWAADQARLIQRVDTLDRQLAQLTGGAVDVTSATHPVNPFVGMLIFETDTDNTLIWDGTTWRVIQTGAPTPYTSTWSSSGAAVSLGSGGGAGVLSASYTKIGRTYNVKIELYGGSATTWGTGTYSLTLPVAADVGGVPSGQFAYVGTILASNAGNTQFYTMGALIDQSTPTKVNGVVNASAAFWGQGTPTTFATTAQAVANITFVGVS